MRRFLIGLLLPLFLVACSGEAKWAPQEAVDRARFVSGAPASVTLLTVISESSGGGAHSALLIDGSERIMFDPAGSWYHPHVPERNDVHYGITERMRVFYLDYHVRPQYYMVEQKLFVSPEIAELLRRKVEANGAVGKMFCARSVSSILSEVPGFESVDPTMMPLALMKDFAEIPGVMRDEFHDGDADIVSGVPLREPAKISHESVAKR